MSTRKEMDAPEPMSSRVCSECGGDIDEMTDRQWAKMVARGCDVHPVCVAQKTMRAYEAQAQAPVVDAEPASSLSSLLSPLASPAPLAPYIPRPYTQPLPPLPLLPWGAPDTFLPQPARCRCSLSLAVHTTHECAGDPQYPDMSVEQIVEYRENRHTPAWWSMSWEPAEILPY